MPVACGAHESVAPRRVLRAKAKPIATDRAKRAPRMPTAPAFVPDRLHSATVVALRHFTICRDLAVFAPRSSAVQPQSAQIDMVRAECLCAAGKTAVR
jgi:hypothetical protein